MNDGGTSLIRLRKVHDLDESHWFEEIKNKCFLAFYPEVCDQILAAGELRKVGRGVRLNTAGTRIDSFYISANAALTMRLSSGRMGDESIFSKVQPMETVGFKEALEGKVFPFSIETEEENTFIFSARKIDLLNILSDEKLVEEVKVLTSSHAVFRLFQWLKSQGIPKDKIRSLYQKIDKQFLLEKQKPIRLNAPCLLLIDDGVVQVFKKDNEGSARILLQRGDWFGASTAIGGSPNELSFSVVEDTYVRSIKLEHLFEILGAVSIEKLKAEPCIEKSNPLLSYEQQGDSAAPFYRVDAVENVKSYGFAIDGVKLMQTKNYSDFSYVTLWNYLQFFEIELHEKQVQSLASSRPLNGLGDYAQVFEDLGFITNLQRLPFDFVLKPEAPMLFLGFGRPLLLLRLTAKEVIMLDPEQGIVGFDRAILFSSWNRVCLRVRESHSKKALRDQLAVLISKPELAGKMLLRYFLGLADREVRNVFVFKLFQSLAVLFVPSYLLGLINQVVTYKRFDYLPVYYMGLGIFICFQISALFLNNYFANLVTVRFKSLVQPYFYKLFLNQPTNFTTSIRAGYIQSRLQLIDYAMAGLKAFKIDLTQGFLTLSMFFLFVGFYSWQAALVLLVFCGFGISATFYLKKHGGLDELGTAQQRQEFVDFGLDMLNGFESIKISHSEKWIRNRFEKTVLQVSKGSADYSKATMGFSQVGNLFFKVGSTLALFVVINELLYTQTPPANALALSMYLSYCTGPYLAILNIFSTYSLGALYSMPGQLIKGESKESFKTAKMISLQGNIGLERVSFRYNDRSPMILNEVSFAVKAGEVVAIVGRSGSGKTTLGRVLSRQVEISGGKLIYDEVDSRLIDPTTLSSQLGFVSQTPTLFAGSIAQNISLSDDTLDYQKIIEAAEASNAHDFIQKLPGGYNYVLSEGGRGLSGGQRVLLTMARVLYSKPKILIIDEATAHLDPKSERLVSERLLNFHARQTVFVIVQRISTARRADRIIVMKNGRVVEIGEHNRLLQNNGEYAELYRHQVGGDQ